MLQNRYVKVLHICVLLIATFHCRQIVGQGSNRNQQQQGQLKQTPERQRKSSDIFKYMNVTQDPCTDFYNYACGNWLRYQDVRGAREGDIVSEAGQLEAKVNRQVQLLLATPTSMRDAYAKPVKDFYRSCTQAPATSPAQREFIKNFVTAQGGMPDFRASRWQPNYNWIMIIANLKRKYNLDILISLSIQNNRGNKVYLDEPQNTILPAQYCGAFVTQQIEERDQAIQMEIKNNLKNWLDFGETDAYRVAGDIMSFEYQLCSNMRKNQMVDVLSNDDGQQQQQLQNQMNSRWQEDKLHGVRRNMNNSPQQLRILEANYRLSFKQFVDVATGNPQTNEAILRSEDYFNFLSTIANKGLQASFANYIMYRALSEITFPYNQRDTESRATFCAQKIMKLFPEVVGSLYSNMNNDRQADRQNVKREDVRQIFSEIKNSFKTYIDTNMKWMPQTTKRIIQNKVAQLELREPEYMDNTPIQGLALYPNQNYWQALEAVMVYSANRTMFKSSSQRSNTVEAFGTTVASNPTDNQLQIGSALLQLPLYSPNYPKSLKYSGLGIVLAREMVKKYDQQGWQDNPMGAGGGNRDAASSAGFRECFRSQVSNYFFNTPEMYRNGTQLRDIMADSLAVDIAFLAYLNWLDKGPEGPELYLETFSDVNFSNTQLFFLNFAQSRCAAKYRDPGTPEFFPLDRHTLERLNINGVLGNGIEFGRDFNCVAGTDMNLGDKCLYDIKNEIKMM